MRLRGLEAGPEWTSGGGPAAVHAAAGHGPELETQADSSHGASRAATPPGSHGHSHWARGPGEATAKLYVIVFRAAPPDVSQVAALEVGPGPGSSAQGRWPGTPRVQLSQIVGLRFLYYNTVCRLPALLVLMLFCRSACPLVSLILRAPLCLRFLSDRLPSL